MLWEVSTTTAVSKDRPPHLRYVTSFLEITATEEVITDFSESRRSSGERRSSSRANAYISTRWAHRKVHAAVGKRAPRRTNLNFPRVDVQAVGERREPPRSKRGRALAAEGARRQRSLACTLFLWRRARPSAAGALSRPSCRPRVSSPSSPAAASPDVLRVVSVSRRDFAVV